MTLFFAEFIILLAFTVIFYLIFFGFIYYWHEKKTTFVVLPLIYTFEFFLVGFLVIFLSTLVVQFSPELLKLIPWQ